MRPAPSIEHFSADRSRALKSARRRRASLRRGRTAASIEALESRTLMAVLPSVQTSGTLAQIMTGFSSGGLTANYSTPSITIDPVNAQKLVASWQVAVTGDTSVDAYVQAASSTNGGNTWSVFYTSSPHLDPTVATNPPTLRDTTDISVAIDRNENVYVLSRNHNAGNTIGYLDLDAYTFSGNTASRISPRRSLANWVGGTDEILEPTLVVDNNLPSYTDTNSAGTTRTIVDPYVGNVYIAWVTNPGEYPATPTSPALPNRVVMIASSNQGQNFTPWQVVDDREFNARNASPHLIVSQGDFNGNVAPGQVTIAWDDFNTGSTDGSNLDYLRTDRVTNGVAGGNFTANAFKTIDDALAGGKDANNVTLPDVPVSTDATINVNITDPNFTTLSTMSVGLWLTAPNLDQLGVELIAPNGLGSVTLFRNRTDGLGAAIAGQGITGANMGTSYLSTTFVDNTPKSITTGTASFLGQFQPEVGSLLALFRGRTAAQLNGPWTLRVTDYRYSGTTPPVQSINTVTLNFGSGLNTGADRVISTTTVRGAGATGVGVATYATASAATPNGIGPGLTLAADNTLGAFSPYQGRIYAAFADRDTATGNPADNTDVYVKYSDDGGATWTGLRRVNDDFPQQDGFSEGNRPQFMPAIAVDQTTGTLVYSYLDTRYDAARARVTTAVTTSIDGGASFALSNYANPSRPVTDAITGKILSAGPIPENQSAGNPVRETNFGFGNHQALAVSGGLIYAAWAGNTVFYQGPRFSEPQYLSGGRDGNQRLSISLQKLVTAAGPRVISGTMGPVGLPGDSLNGSRLPDGTPVANSIIVTFDRPVDPNSFTPADVQVIYRNTNAATGGSPTSLGIRSVTPQNTNQYGATRFKIVFVSPTDPDGIGGNGVGTYSYIIGPNVNDRIRAIKTSVVANGGTQTFNASGTQVGIAIPPTGTGGTGDPAQDVATSSLFVNTGNVNDVVKNVAVHVSISHTWTSDLTLTLISPSGTRIVLADRLDGDTVNGYFNTTFDDSAAAAIFNAVAPYTGSFRPESPLSVLTGQNVNGTWKLEINDEAGLDVGTLNAWSLQITAGHFVTSTSSGNLMDQNASATAGEVLGDRFAVPTPLNGNGTLNPPFDTDTLPLIVSGPYLQSTHVAGTPTSYDNLVLDNTASSIDLTFDRYMDAGSFDAADILRIQGPSGVVPSPYTITPVYNSTNVNIGIGPNATTTSTLNIPTLGGPLTIDDLNVQVNISHGHSADLTLTLIAPDGTRIKLAQGLGGTVGKDYKDTVFDDEAAAAIASGTSPFNGSFRPAESLAALKGMNLAAGQWRLEIVNAAGVTGILNAWSLAVTPKAGTAAYARTFRVGFPQQELSGTYIVNLNSGIKSMAGDALDSNHNAGLDILRGTADPNGATIPVTYTNSAPTPIPDATSDGATPPVITPGIVTSVINITDSYVPTDVTVTLSINDPFDPDLEVTLIAPDGTRITLVNQRGQGVNTANFQGTIFNDAGTTPIQNGGAPFNGGPYRPEPTAPDGSPNSLSEIVNNQINVLGAWTLEVKDHNTGNTGTLVTWSLTFQKPIPSSGLGEVSGDRTEASFRIFTMAADNSLSSAVWTPVGGAANGSGRSRMGGIAVDPSDTSGNTVYVGGASGGVWKTTNFLTTASGGPTYIPVTNFGPTNSANIGGLVVIGRNGDPSQSIIFATTGEGDSGSPGVGMLRSMDGGATWISLDSTVNFDSAGNMLPYNSPLRDHAFIGSTSFKIVADPNLSPSGEAIVYAALSGNNGGIWRSEDSGRTWGILNTATGKRVANLSGQATDVELAQNSGTGAPGGNLQQVFAAIRGDGVYFSPNRGQVWSKMAGGVGNPLIQDGDKNPSTPIPVTAPVDTPNGPKGRIVLAVPQLTGDLTQDIQYQGWLYATVVTTNDHLDGVYLTKDFGRNWTRVRIPTLPPIPGAGGGNSAVQATPTNDYSAKNPDYDVAGNAVFAQGNYDIAMTIDPTNPNVIYIGGTNDGQPSSLIRIDVTHIKDAHSEVAFDEGNPGVGQNSTASVGGVALKTPVDPNTRLPKNYYNLNGQPGNPYGNSTFPVTNTASFTNDGSDATWTPFDFTIGDNHRFIAVKDPLTGHARLIAGDDHGVWTAVDNNGVQTSGVGTAATPSGDRTGNLQLKQFYYGAARPDGTAFYGQAQDNGSPSSGNVLDTGNIGWADTLGDGTGVAVDQTGTGTVYRYNWPCCGGDGTNFFQVNGVGRTQGLIQASNPGNAPDPQWPFVGGFNFAVNPINGNQILISSGAGRVFSTENQGVFWSVIGEPDVFGNSHAEALAYGAPDPNGPAGEGNFDNFLYVGTQAGKIYMSQVGGGGSGNAWTDISAGLFGGAIRSIVTNPNRGSHEAYAVTNGGVFHIVDSTAPGATWQNINGIDVAGEAPHNLFSLTHNLFGDPNQVDTLLRGLTSLAVDWRYVIPTSFTNPSPVGTFPILYVGGNGGVFRSIDNGKTWGRFPDAALNNTPIQAGNGGLFPVVQVNDLDLALGNIDPTTGRPSTYNSQNVLLATTYGQGSFAIRLAPIVFPTSIAIDYTAPLPANQGGSDSGNTAIDQGDFITNVLTPVIDGFSASTAFGQVVTIKLYDLTDPTNPVQIGQGITDAKGFFKVQVDPGHFLPDGSTDGLKTIGVQASDLNQAVGNMETIQLTIDHTIPAKPAAPDLQAASDHGDSSTDNITNVPNPTFNVQLIEQKARVVLYRDGVAVADFSDVVPDASGVYAITDPNALEGAHLYTVVQYDVATNKSLESDPLSVLFDFTKPAAPNAPDLRPGDDSGISNSDNNTATTTNLRFNTNLIEPNAKLELLRDGVVVPGATIANVGTPGGAVTITDPTALADGVYSYTLQQTDLGGNLGPQSAALLVTIDTTKPAAPTAPDLQAADDKGSSNSDNVTQQNVNLHFDILGIEPGGKNATVSLYRDGAFVVSVDYSTTGQVTLIDPTVLADGVYVYTATQTDLAGNVSAISAGLSVTIDTLSPITPTAPDLQAADDTGISNSDNNTATTTNLHFDTTLIEPAARLDLLRDGVIVNSIANVGAGAAVTITDPTALADGVYVYTLQQTDLANNLGPVSAPLTVTIDTTKPAPPAAPDLQAADDKGSSNSDNVTKINANLHFDILGIETGGKNATVSLYRDGAFVVSVDYSTSGQVTLIDPTVLADGVYVYTAKQTDLAGNVSDLGAALSVTFYTVLPVAPTAPDLQTADDSGISNSDNNTATTTNLHFDTTLIEPNAKLELLRDGVIVPGATITNVGTPGGAVTAIDPTALADGVYVYTLQQTDLAGNLGPASGSLSVTIDTSQPAAPIAPDLQAADDKGSSDSDNVTKQNVNLHFDILGIEPGGKNATVSLYRDGVFVVSVDYSTTGQVTLIDPTVLADGVYVYTATQTDLAGNVSAISTGLSVTVDAAPPIAPTAPDLKAADDSGTFNNDNYTKVTTNLRFDTTLIEPFAKLELLRNGVVVPGATITNVGTPGGAITITDPTVLTDGVYSYTLQQTDLGGNLGPVSAALSVTVDTTNPAAPSVPDLQAASDSGVFNNDNITFITNPTFDVPSAESTAIVHLLRNGVEVNTRTGPGAIQDPGPVPDGTYSYTTYQTDLAGNDGPASAPLSVTIDTTAPAGPVADLQAGSDTGQSNSDNLTSATLLALVGGYPKFDISPVELGGFVELFRNGALVSSGRLLTGAGTITLSDQGPSFPDGKYTYTVRQTDLAGNLGTVGAPLVVTVDNTAPLAPAAPDLQAASDSGASNTDNVTSVTNPKFDVSNTEAGSTLSLLRDGVVVATLTNIAGGTTTIQDPGPVADGTHVYSAYSFDQAGNIGPIGGALQVVINTSAAAAPATPDLQAASDSGTSTTDNLTNNTAPTFNVAGVDPGATIQLYRNGVLVNSQVNAAGVNATVPVQDPGPVQPDGVYLYTARQISASGIAGPVSGALSVTIDTVAAAPDAPDLQASSDTGNSSTDNVTSIVNPTFDVTGAEAGATVDLYRKAAGALDSTYQKISTRTGNGPITDPGPLADGTYVYSLIETDAAGNLSPRSAVLSVTINTAPPDTPGAPDLQAASDTPLLNAPGYTAGTTDTDNVTSLRTLKFDIIAAGQSATIRLLRNGVIVATAAGNTGVLQGDGSYRYTMTDTVTTDGSYNYTSQAVNGIGIVSGFSAALLVRVDALAPGTLTAPDLQPASDSGISATDNITSASAPVFTISGGIEGGATVQLLRKPSGSPDSSYAVAGFVTNPGSGIPTIAVTDASLPPNGVYDYAVRQFDLAGNIGTISQPLTVTIDATTPAAPAAPDLQAASDSGASNVDNVTNVVGGKRGSVQLPQPTFDITGLAPGLTVELLRKPAGAEDSAYVPVKSITADGGSATIVDPGPVLDGRYVYAVRATTPAGGVSPISPTLTVTYDTKPVAVVDPVLSNIYGTQPTTTVSRTPTFTGKTEPGAILGLFVLTPGRWVKVASTVSDATGAYSLAPSQPMLNGTYFFQISVVDFAGNARADGNLFGNPVAITVTSVANDYDGDGKSDLAFDRQGANVGDYNSWNILNAAGTQSTLFDNKGDIPLSGDFNGDGKADLAVFRPSNPNLLYPLFIIKMSGGPNVFYSLGGYGDVPAPADYDGDGKTDMAVYRPSTGQWFINSSQTGVTSLRVLGGAAGDVPVPADYLGTGSAQLAVFRQPDASSAYPYYQIQAPTAGTPDTIYSIGGYFDVATPGDFNGDGKADFAVYRPSASQWYIRYNGGGGQNVQVGTPNDIPVVGDFDGDGKADAATYRPSTGLWSINQSTAGPRVQNFGGALNDVPIAAPYSYRKQASVSIPTGTAGGAAAGSFDLGGTAAKLSNTLSASRVVVNQATPKKESFGF
jgi:subtilisin-like proprotein convertase family protein